MRIQSKKVKLVVPTPTLVELLDDSELLYSDNPRANVLVVKMNFQGKKISFAIPWRSNLKKGATPPYCFYNLPNTTKTSQNRIACLDFTKAFPLPNKNINTYYNKYNVNETKDAQTLMFIDKNIKNIISNFQAYLDQYDRLPSTVYHVDLCKCHEKLKKEDLL
ncbi:hypothetical protein ACA584_15040 [Lactiplantibacillus plantarum]|uniref:hypothetical protein n=1 Tax=Lactiplantibacillus plantarum TaxID=1590 RepID=UPI003C18402A